QLHQAPAAGSSPNRRAASIAQEKGHATARDGRGVRARERLSVVERREQRAKYCRRGPMLPIMAQTTNANAGALFDLDICIYIRVIPAHVTVTIGERRQRGE